MVTADERVIAECRWCPVGCPQCEPSDCECYQHQDWTDKSADPNWPYRAAVTAEGEERRDG